MQRIRALWNRGLFGKVVLISGGVLGLLVICCVALLIFVPSSPRTAQNTTAAPAAAAQATSAPQPTEKEKATETPAPTSPPAPTAPPAATLTPVEGLRAAIVAALGRSNREVDRVITVAFDPDQADPQIFVRWNINDNITDNLRSSGARRDVAKIVQAVAESGVPYGSIQVEGVFPLVDKLGNTDANAIVVRAHYPRATVEKINWANFLAANIYDIGEDVVIHPALKPE